MLHINAAAFLRELAWLGSHSRARKATISAILGHALIVVGPLEVSIPCRGELPGAITFSARALRDVAKSPLDGAEIEVDYSDGRLLIGGIAVPATA